MSDMKRTQEFFAIHNEFVSASDPEVAEALENERKRQNEGLELIASENFVSPGVLAAMGSVMTNKYAEGYPGRRYYGGCQFVDVAENLAIERAKELFGVGFANVQPNSGSQANQGVFQALIQPGDTILGMSLDAGGHHDGHGHDAEDRADEIGPRVTLISPRADDLQRDIGQVRGLLHDAPVLPANRVRYCSYQILAQGKDHV